MNNRRRKSIALLLAIVMTIAALPMNVLADLISTDYSSGISVRSIISTPVPDTFTHHFVSGGAIVDTQIVRDQEYLLEPAAPEIPGQKFTGWYIQGASAPLDFTRPISVTSTQTITVEARYTPVVYVTFLHDDTPDGTDNFKVVNTKEVVPGTTVDTVGVPVVTWPGMVFGHWSATKNGPAYDFSTPISANTTLYAVLTSKWIVHFDPQGGTYVPEQYVVNNQTASVPSPAPTRQGYTFARWSAAPNGATAYNFSTPILKDTTLYAVWTPNNNTPYTVVYWKENPNDSGYVIAEVVSKTGTTGQQATYDLKTYPGFTLNSAKTAASAVTIAGDGSTIRNVYYSRNTYTLTIMRQTSSTYDTWGLVSTSTFKYGQSTALAYDPVSTQYSTYLWYVEKYGNIAYSEAPAMPNANTTIYGRYAGAYTYTTHYQEQSTKKTIHPAYTFKAGLGLTYSIEDGIDIKGFTVVPTVSSWEPLGDDRIGTIYYTRKNYTITFQKNDGTANTATAPIPYEADISGKALSGYTVGVTTYKNPTDGYTYTFAGWYENSAFIGTPYSFAGKTMPAENMMLYAKWLPPQLNVRFHENALYNSPYSNQVVSIGTAVAERPAPPAPSGATAGDFMGWYRQVGGSMIKYDFSNPVYEDIDLYPMWHNPLLHVTYDTVKNGGSGTVTDGNTYSYATYATVLSASGVTPPAGQVFLGWLSSADNKLYYPGDKIPMLSNVTLTAQYGPASLPTKLTYDANGGLEPDIVLSLLNNTTHTVENNTFTRPGYRFTGWNTASDGSGTALQPGSKILVDRIDETNNVLYAQWEQLIWVKATKVWSGGTTRGEVTLQLRRNGINEGDPVTTTNGTYTWTDLVRLDAAGAEYNYTVVETAVPGYHVSYARTRDELGNISVTVTNTYEIPTDGTAAGKKIWVNGPAAHPELWLQLWRKTTTGTPLKDEAVPSAAVIKANAAGNTAYTWTGLETTDFDGNPYTFYLKEGQYDGAAFTPGVPANYALTGEGSLELTNSYVIPTTGPVEATKTWVNGPDTRPTVWFQLQRRIARGAWEAVPGASVMELPNGTTSVSWPSTLEATDISGNAYTFSVVEGQYDGAAFTPGAPIHYQQDPATLNTLHITNTYVPPLREDITVGKIWDMSGVAGVVPVPVTLQLWRQAGAAGTPELAGEVELNGEIDEAGETAAWHYTFKDLPDTDINGVPYIYSVQEKTVPANFDAAVNAFDVTNTWQIQSYTIAKAWAGEYPGQPRPAVTMQLYRVASGMAQPEAYGGPVQLDGTPDGAPGSVSGEHAAWRYTWEQLPERDANDNPYTYSAREVRLEGYTPSGPSSVDGVNTYTNTWEGVAVSATKVIVIPDGAAAPSPLPNFSFVLMRNGVPYKTVQLNGTADTPAADGSGETAPTDARTWHYSWPNLPRYDENGAAYVYTVEEPNLPPYFVRQSVVGDMAAGFTITNEYRQDTFRAYKYWSTKAGTVPVTFQLWQQQLDASGQVIAGSQVNMNMDVVLDGVIDAPSAAYEEQPWRAAWTGLPTTRDGLTVTYYVVETVTPEFEALYDTVTSASTAVTNTSLSANVTARKVWSGGPAAKPDAVFTIRRYLEDGITEDTSFDVAGSRFTLVDGVTEHTWTNLTRFYDEGGVRKEYVYNVTEETDPENYQMTDNTLADGVHTITNTYVPPTFDFLGIKVWDGGRQEPLTFKLLRKLEGSSDAPVALGPGATLDGAADGSVDPVTGAQEIRPWVLERKGLPLTDQNGVPYIYSVVEVTDLSGKGFAAPVYEYGATVGGTAYTVAVTNSYVIPTDGTASAGKTWVDGPATHPALWLQLWRKTSTGIDEPVPGAQVFAVSAAGDSTTTWSGLETTDGSANPYTFYVKEGLWDGANFTEQTPENYVLSGEGTLNLTNTYQSPANGSATASKEWLGGSSRPRPEVWFQLWRQDSTGQYPAEAVPGAEVKQVPAAAPLEVTWTGLTENTPKGDPYTFFVVEGTYDGEHFTAGDPANYRQVPDSLNTLKAVNEYVSPAQTHFTAYKDWAGGPAADQTAPKLELWRQVENGTPEMVTGAPDPAVSGSAPHFTYHWADLPDTDYDGNPYTYSVRESGVDAQGNILVNGNTYAVSYNTAYTTVTNTYAAPLSDVTASKTWSGGPLPRPTVWFQLWRRVEGGVWQQVPGAKLMELPDGTTQAVWPSLPETDNDGRAYVYGAVEGTYTDADGFILGAPVTYRVSGEYTLSLTNTYVSPVTALSAEKTWINGPSPRPTVWFQLMRQAEGGAIEEVPNGLRELPDGTLSVTWRSVDKTDQDGKPYTFTVREVDANGADWTPDNYTAVISNDPLGVANSYQSPLIDVTASKIWENGDALKYYAVPLTLWRKTADGTAMEEVPAGYTVANVDGTPADGIFNQYDYTWADLPATDISGNAYTYYFTEEPVTDYTRTYDNPYSLGGAEYGVSGSAVKNSYTPPTIPLTGYKYWFYGEVYDKPIIYFNLYRSLDPSGEVDLELLNPSPLMIDSAGVPADPTNPDLTVIPVDWGNVELTDINGQPYTFFMKEVDANGVEWTPEFYTKYEFETDVLNLYEAKTQFVPEADKVLNGRPLKAGEFQFELYEIYGAADGTTVESLVGTATNDAAGRIVFDAIGFDATDIPAPRNYILREVIPAAPETNMVYHTQDLHLTVTASYPEVADGTLTLTAEYPNGQVFTNSYTAAGELPSGAWATKALAGRALAEGEFTFELRGNDGTVLQTKTNAADGSITFDAIGYTEKDIGQTYTYTIQEVIPEPGAMGMTYDPMVLTFTVSVTDAGNGALNVTPSFPADTEFNNVFTAMPSFTVDKTTTVDRFSKVGDTIPYTVTVVNTGNVAIPNLTVEDTVGTPAKTYTLTDMTLAESAAADKILEVGET